MTFVLGCLVVGLGIGLVIQWRAFNKLDDAHRRLYDDYAVTQKHADRLLARCNELEGKVKP